MIDEKGKNKKKLFLQIEGVNLLLVKVNTNQ
jgi:hypothetical protein